MDSDISMENHFSLWLARPPNSHATEWLHESAPYDAMFFSGALVIEPRHVEGFVAVAGEEGFSVN